MVLKWPECVPAADPSPPDEPAQVSARRLVACFRIEFEAAIQGRAQHAVMKVRQPQNMLLAKPNLSEVCSVGLIARRLSAPIVVR